jgi:endonuclease/exonuclease/phosphatase family metal-dependent hydrolase
MDLQKEMPQFKYTGVGRTDGKQKGEYSAIFYDTTRLQLLRSDNFWLAAEMNIPGKKGWDASYERIVTWAKFRDRKTQKEFFQFNTHYDHMGKIARRESSLLLMTQVTKIAGKLPVIITGDFNAQPQEDPIRILTDSSNSERFTDSRSVSHSPHYGPEGTFNAFGPKETHDQPIDYIFIKGSINVLRHATLSQTWNGRFASDHFSVLATVQIL